MFTELKRCNSIGNTKGILFLISIIAGKEKISRTEIRNRCALENGVSVNCPGAIAFFEFLQLITTTEVSATPCEKLNELACLQDEKIVSSIADIAIARLVDEGIFDNDATGFDPEKGLITIKRSAFPLAYAAIRNFLIIAGALSKEVNGENCITDDFESDWTETLGKRRKKLTLEQLLKKQEDQNQRGLEAEEFVLASERTRLPGKARFIKRISDYDASAGYDIVSYSDEQSKAYDRLIEVKCYIGDPHFFWSENESDVAKVKGDKYFLCLVDYEHMKDPGYQPAFIQNPYDKIFNDPHWLVTTASYKIQRV